MGVMGWLCNLATFEVNRFWRQDKGAQCKKTPCMYTYIYMWGLPNENVSKQPHFIAFGGVFPIVRVITITTELMTKRQLLAQNDKWWGCCVIDLFVWATRNDERLTRRLNLRQPDSLLVLSKSENWEKKLMFATTNYHCTALRRWRRKRINADGAKVGGDRLHILCQLWKYSVEAPW